MKKVISVVLSCILIFAAAGIPAAASTVTYDVPATGTLTIAATEYSASYDFSENSTEIKIEGGVNVSFNQADYVDYVLNVEKSGIYSLGIYASTSEGNKAVIDILVDDEVKYRHGIPGKGFSSYTTTYCYIYLEAGTRTLRLYGINSGMYLVRLNIGYKTDVSNFENSSKVGFSQENSRIVFAAEIENDGIYKLDLTATQSTKADIYIYSNDGYLNSFSFPKSFKASTNSVYIKLKQGLNIVKMNIASGSLKATGLIATMVTESDEEKILGVLKKISNAEDGDAAYSVIKVNENILGINIDDLTKSLSYPEFVFIRLAGRTYLNTIDFYNGLFDAVTYETNTPSVKTAVSGTTLTVTAKTDIYKSNGIFAAALYEGNRLKSMNFKEFIKGTDISIPLVNYSSGMMVKFFTFDTITEINPSDLSNGICREVYVSTRGNDETGDGTEEKPFATINRAKQRTSELTSDMTGDIVVNIAPGYYELNETEVFGMEHGGNDSFKVIYRGTDKNNMPVISGGKKVTDWVKGEKGIYSAPLAGPQVRDLFVGDYPAIRARSKYTFSLDEYIDDLTISVSKSGMPESFAYPEDLVFVWNLYWATQYTPVESATDNGENMTFVMEDIFAETVGTENIRIDEKKRFYMENALELLDEPGEFYHDSHNGRIYYMPYPEEDMTKVDTYVSNLDRMIEISGTGKDAKVKNIVFDAISFRYGTRNSNSMMQIQADQHYDCGVEMKMPAQFVVNNAEFVSIQNCEFSCIGSGAIEFKDAVSNSVVAGNIIKDIGGGGISIGNFMRPRIDDEGEFCTDITVSDNVIRRTSLTYRGTTAIAVYYEKNINIIRNDIADLPYTGISAGWGWGTAREKFGNINISQNRIDNVVQVLTDGGHIYTLGNMPGSVISENYMTKSGDYRGGIYTDSGSQNISLLNNVCDNSSLWWHVGLYYTKDMTASGNVSPRNFINDSGENIVVKNHVEVKDGDYRSVAAEIMEKAGVSSEYEHLLEKAELDEWREPPLTIPHETYTETQETWIEAEDFLEGYGTGYCAHNHNEPYNNIYRPEGLNLYRNYLTNKGYFIHRVSNGDWMAYSFTVPETGTYSFDLKAANGYDDTYNTIVDVSVDGSLKFNDFKFPTTGKWHIFTPVRLGYVNLEAGTHVVKIEYAGSGFHIDALKFEKAPEIRVQMSNHTSAYCSFKKTNSLYVENGNTTWHVNDWAEYSVKINTPGTYRFGMEFGSSVGSGLRNVVSVNGVEKINALKLSTGTFSDKKDVDFGDIIFDSAGTYTLRVENTGGGGGHYVEDIYLEFLNEEIK